MTSDGAPRQVEAGGRRLRSVGGDAVAPRGAPGATLPRARIFRAICCGFVWHGRCFSGPPMLPLLLVGLAVCCAAAVLDFRTGRIPNALTYPVLVLAPVAHVALAVQRGAPWREALLAGGASVLGLVLCALVPLYLWKKGAMGGGDVKLFAALGALALPRVGFEAEMYVFIVAALMAPVELVYRGTLFRTLANVGAQLVNPFRARERRRALDPALTSWFRLGPCFAIGFAVQVLVHWRSPW